MRTSLMIAVALAACAVLATSCGDDGSRENVLPDTALIGAPENGSQHSYRVVMSWIGTDPDGEVAGYETAWHDGMLYSGMFDDLVWEETDATEDTFKVAADTCPAIGQICHHGHAFLVRAIDNDGGKDPTPATVGFDATTFTPRSEIVYPVRSSGQLTVTLPTCVEIRWEGTDSDGEAVMFRYAMKKYFDAPAGQPPPEGSRWSPWTSGREVVIRMLPNDPEDPWSFYSQAKDDAGAIENVFEDARNHIVINVDESLDSHPFVTICCLQGACDDIGAPSLGCCSTSDPEQMNEPISVPVGTEISFKATGFPGQYAGAVTHIAYMINDSEEPTTWSDYTKEENRCHPRGSQGILVSPDMNAYYVWVRDDYCEFGSTAFAYIVINGVTK